MSGIPSDYVRDVCKIGQGVECCSFLTAGVGGLECAKGDHVVEAVIRRRRETGQMHSMGDNCDGWRGAA